MSTQLSLFDWSGSLDSMTPVVTLDRCRVEATELTANAPAAPQPVRLYGEASRHDAIQPMGDLARLVIARYEMMARRREEMTRREGEQPRRSIRVLS